MRPDIVARRERGVFVNAAEGLQHETLESARKRYNAHKELQREKLVLDALEVFQNFYAADLARQEAARYGMERRPPLIPPGAPDRGAAQNLVDLVKRHSVD